MTLGYLFFSSIQNEAHLLNLGVREDFQRKKIGSSLMDAFINQCYAMDIQKIFLEVREANNKAINFYKKNGFVEKSDFFFIKKIGLHKKLVLKNQK